MMITILTTENKPTDLRMYDFSVVLMDLDTMIGEGIYQNSDDSYTIFLNSRWTSEEQKRCLLHAFDHVRHHDFEKFDVQEIEAEAHTRR